MCISGAPASGANFHVRFYPDVRLTGTILHVVFYPEVRLTAQIYKQFLAGSPADGSQRVNILNEYRVECHIESYYAKQNRFLFC